MHLMINFETNRLKVFANKVNIFQIIFHISYIIMLKSLISVNNEYKTANIVLIICKDEIIKCLPMPEIIKNLAFFYVK